MPTLCKRRRRRRTTRTMRHHHYKVGSDFLCAPLLLLLPSSLSLFLLLLLFHSPPSFTHIFLMFHTPPQTLQSVLRKLLEQPRHYVADVCFEYPQGKIYAHRGMNGGGWGDLNMGSAMRLFILVQCSYYSCTSTTSVHQQVFITTRS